MALLHLPGFPIAARFSAFDIIPRVPAQMRRNRFHGHLPCSAVSAAADAGTGDTNPDGPNKTRQCDSDHFERGSGIMNRCHLSTASGLPFAVCAASLRQSIGILMLYCLRLDTDPSPSVHRGGSLTVISETNHRCDRPDQQ
jgi:hypothetical protein